MNKTTVLLQVVTAALIFTLAACGSSGSGSSAGSSQTLSGAGTTIVVPSTTGRPNPGSGASTTTAPPTLESPHLWVVYSATDDDAQLFLNVGATEALRSLTVTGPDGTTVFDGTFNDAGNLGQADITLEGPEPSLGALRAAFPPGAYHFTASTVTGTSLDGTAELTYDLLDNPVIESPAPDATGVALVDTVLRWHQIPGADRIHIEVETLDERDALKVDLLGDATSFTIPPEYLLAHSEYVFDVKAVAASGNMTVADLTFTTAR